MKLSKLLLMAGMAAMVLLGCKKEIKTKITTGEFIAEDVNADGTATGGNTNYKGMCIATASYDCAGQTNVSIAHNNGTNQVAIFNIPGASSGTFDVPDSWENFNKLVGSCSFYMMCDLGEDNYYGSSGTLVKTGPRSFTFSIRMKKAGGKSSRLLSGNGNY